MLEVPASPEADAGVLRDKVLDKESPEKAQAEEVKLLPDEKELADGLVAAKTEAEQETVIEKFLKGFKGNE